MKRRTVALLLSLVMAVCCLSGCTSTRVRSYTEESGNAATDKYAAAVSAYGSNKKVMTVNGSPVYWNEYAYFLCAILANMERYGMQVSDWSAVYDESSQSTYADLMTESIVNNIAWNHLIEVKAAENDVTFDAAGEQFVQDTVDQTIRNVVGDGGTETELNEKLRSYYMDLDLFKYFTKVQYLYNALAEKLFGADGASITDDDVQEFAETNSYTTAKHILLKTIDDSGKAIADDEKAAKKQKADKIAAQLKAVTDPEQRAARFDELMAEYNEDTGENSYPHGYCFTSGSMVTAAAIHALQSGFSNVSSDDFQYLYAHQLTIDKTGNQKYSDWIKTLTWNKIYANGTNHYKTATEDFIRLTSTNGYRSLDITARPAAGTAAGTAMRSCCARTAARASASSPRSRRVRRISR